MMVAVVAVPVGRHHPPVMMMNRNRNRNQMDRVRYHRRGGVPPPVMMMNRNRNRNQIHRRRIWEGGQQGELKPLHYCAIN